MILIQIISVEIEQKITSLLHLDSPNTQLLKKFFNDSFFCSLNYQVVAWKIESFAKLLFKIRENLDQDLFKNNKNFKKNDLDLINIDEERKALDDIDNLILKLFLQIYDQKSEELPVSSPSNTLAQKIKNNIPNKESFINLKNKMPTTKESLKKLLPTKQSLKQKKNFCQKTLYQFGQIISHKKESMKNKFFPSRKIVQDESPHNQYLLFDNTTDLEHWELKNLFDRLFCKEMFHSVYARTLWFLLIAFPGMKKTLFNIANNNKNFKNIIIPIFLSQDISLIKQIENKLFSSLFKQYLIIQENSNDFFQDKTEALIQQKKQDIFTNQIELKQIITAQRPDLYAEDPKQQEKLNQKKMQDKIFKILKINT